MQLFCDQCGTELGALMLRADSKFCSSCGKALSDYIKQQSSSLFKSSPKGGRIAHVSYSSPTSPNNKTSKKRKSEDHDERDHVKQAKRDSIQHDPSTTPAQPNGEPDTTDGHSSEGNQASDETEVLGKGKRIRRLTQRYTDEPFSASKLLTNSPRPKPGPTTPATPTKSNNSLAQILNSAPISGQSPSHASAASLVPIDVSAFKLPPKYHVAEIPKENGQMLKREAIAQVLGGSLKTTFPYPRDRAEGPPYACLKESENDYLPKAPGDNGIVIVKDLPEALPQSGFTLFIKDKKTSDWTYFGKYKVVYTFTVSTEQWLAFGDRTKAHKVSGTLRAAWGKEWCVEKGVAPTFDGMLKAFDDGDMHWHAYVVQCVDYDTKLFQRLIRAIAS